MIRLVLQTEAHADQYRDVDFSSATVKARWAAGSKDANRALTHQAWLKPVPPHAGLIIHELEQE